MFNEIRGFNFDGRLSFGWKLEMKVGMYNAQSIYVLNNILNSWSAPTRIWVTEKLGSMFRWEMYGLVRFSVSQQKIHYMYERLMLIFGGTIRTTSTRSTAWCGLQYIFQNGLNDFITYYFRALYWNSTSMCYFYLNHFVSHKHTSRKRYFRIRWRKWTKNETTWRKLTWRTTSWCKLTQSLRKFPFLDWRQRSRACNVYVEYWEIFELLFLLLYLLSSWKQLQMVSINSIAIKNIINEAHPTSFTPFYVVSYSRNCFCHKFRSYGITISRRIDKAITAIRGNYAGTTRIF